MRNSLGLMLFYLLVWAAPGCSKPSAHEYIADAEQAAARGELLVGIIQLKNAIQLDASNPQAHLLLGDLYLKTQRFKNAEAAFVTAQQLGIPEETVAQRLIEVKFGLRQYDTVLRLIREMSEAGELPPDLLEIQAQTHEQLRDYDSARQMYLELASPDKYKLANLERKAGRYEVALTLLEGDRRFADTPESLLLRARMVRFFNPAASVGGFSDTLKHKSLQEAALRDLVRTNWLTGNLTAAREHLRQLQESTPDKRTVLYFSALDQLIAGAPDTAYQSFRIQNSHTPRAYYLKPLGLAAYRANNLPASRSALQRLLANQQDDAAAKLLVAVLSKEGRFDEIRSLIYPYEKTSLDAQLLKLVAEHALLEGDHNIVLRALERLYQFYESPQLGSLVLDIDVLAIPDRARLRWLINEEVPPGYYGADCFNWWDQSRPTGSGECDPFAQEANRVFALLRNGETSMAKDALRKIDAMLPPGNHAATMLARFDDPRFTSSLLKMTNIQRNPGKFGSVDLGLPVSNKDAQQMLKTYSSGAPQSVEVAISSALLLARTGKVEESKAALEGLVGIAPDLVLESLAQLHLSTNSASRWLRAVRQKLDRLTWKSWSMRLIRARIYEDDRNLSTTARIAQQMQDLSYLNPGLRPHYLLDLAELQRRVGQSQLARTNYSKAVSQFNGEALRALIKARLSGLPPPVVEVHSASN